MISRAGGFQQRARRARGPLRPGRTRRGWRWRPKTTAAIDEETAATPFKLLETLEDSDDVQNVYANFEVGEDVMARLERLIRRSRGRGG